MPSMLGLPLQWSVGAVAASFPSLIGHLMYGVVLALVYHHLQQRYRALHLAPLSAANHETDIAPALWMLVAVCLVVILLLQT
jgi:hypothetical protein